MQKILFFLTAMLLCCCSADNEMKAETPANTGNTSKTGKTLVVYYSYTGNCREIVNTLTSQIEADVLEIQPAEKGLRYEANNYALGTQLLNAIKANPNDISSYPAIDPVAISLSDYQNIIIITPLWWSQMAAIMQSYLFQSASLMAGKHVSMIISSHSSGISGVVNDAKRLLPNVTWMGDALWINASNHSNRASLIENWLKMLNFDKAQTTMDKIYITIGGQTQSVTVAALQDTPITVTLNDNNFEIWGSLGRSLTTKNEQMTAQAGDIVLYNGSNICIFYDSNSWSYTRLGQIDGLSESELRSFLKAGENNIKVTLSLNKPTGINTIKSEKLKDKSCYTLQGTLAQAGHKGIIIQNGKKIIRKQ